MFYHKRAHYHPGNTPLVGWLKVYMIPQIIGMDVPVEFLQNVPEVHKLKLLKDNETFRERGKSKEKGDDNEMQVEQHKRQNKQKKSKGKQMVVDESIVEWSGQKENG